MDNIDRIVQDERCNALIMSEDVLDIFLPVEIDLTQILRNVDESCVKILYHKYMILYTYASNLLNPQMIERYYRGAPKCYGLMDTYNIDAMGVSRLRRQPGFAFYGTGVMIGFIDTGINYQNPLFVNRDGTSRIHSIWDQTINIKNEISYMGYGREYRRDEINTALKSENPLQVVPSRDEQNHGTFLAAAAAGNEDYANDFSGVAPSADIVMVKLKPAKRTVRSYFLVGEDALSFQENDIALGIKYLLNVSREMNKPMAICLGVGTNSGGHDGSNVLAEYLDDISNTAGICMVVATGNESGSRGHYISIGRRPGEAFEDVELRVGEGEESFVIELWASPPQLYSIELISPSGEYFRPRYSRVDSFDYADFIFEATIVYIGNYVQEPRSGNHLIFMRFFHPAPGIWTVRVVNEEPNNITFNMWLPIKQFLHSDTYFLRSSPMTTITEPGNADVPITIAAYNHINNSIYINSGRGYTRTGRIKPDIAAPGVNIYGPSAYAGFTRRTGTSIAAAQAAGVAVLMLEWGVVDGNRPFMDTTEIKVLLIRGSTRTEMAYPNREWGGSVIIMTG